MRRFELNRRYGKGTWATKAAVIEAMRRDDVYSINDKFVEDFVDTVNFRKFQETHRRETAAILRKPSFSVESIPNVEPHVG